MCVDVYSVACVKGVGWVTEVTRHVQSSVIALETSTDLPRSSACVCVYLCGVCCVEGGCVYIEPVCVCVCVCVCVECVCVCVCV